MFISLALTLNGVFIYLMPGQTWLKINIQTNIRGIEGETKIKGIHFNGIKKVSHSIISDKGKG